MSEPKPLWAKPAKLRCWMICDHGMWRQGFYASQQSAQYRKSELTPWYLDVCEVEVTIEPIEQEAGGD